jgi:hypothetical protein
MPVVHNSGEVSRDFTQAGATIEQRVDRVRRHHAMLLQVRIQAHASGRPGPRIITGDYNRSWNTTHVGDTSIVGTNKPQARRLEYGFYGPDRLGRVYNQRPYPHVGPAVDETIPGFQAALRDLADDV